MGGILGGYHWGMRTRAFLSATLLLATLLAGCGGVGLWPFGESGGTERSRKPPNATEYACDGGKAFYVRRLDPTALWLMLPDRELRVTKLGGNGNERYGAAKVELEISGAGATLLDPPSQYSGCKRIGST
jgi:hypothetical protein